MSSLAEYQIRVIIEVGRDEVNRLASEGEEVTSADAIQRHRPSFLHLRLRHSLTAQDDLTEKLASAFIDGRPLPIPSSSSSYDPSGVSRTDSPAFGREGISTPVGASGSGVGNTGRAVDDFISEFKAARKTYHKRAIWAERWSRGEVAWRDD